jgi:hypothetical protein
MAVLRTFLGELPQHHVRVVDEILIDVVSVLGLAEVYPLRLRFNRPVAFLKNRMSVTTVVPAFLKKALCGSLTCA